jgi:hypothetical protein
LPYISKKKPDYSLAGIREQESDIRKKKPGVRENPRLLVDKLRSPVI